MDFGVLKRKSIVLMVCDTDIHVYAIKILKFSGVVTYIFNRESSPTATSGWGDGEIISRVCKGHIPCNGHPCQRSCKLCFTL